MKKLLILVAVLMLAIPAFSQASRFPGAAGAGTTLNDDSCDIGVTPAATLLLPYFEVDFNSNANEAVNTVFTLTNVSDMPQIAHVTIWTDWSVPVIDFNIFLTGYDVQGISLYDIIARGEIPPTSILTGNRSVDSPEGPFSEDNITGNPAFRAGVATACANLPGSFANTPLLQEIQDALTGLEYNFTNAQGIPSGCVVGGLHDNAVGYVTIDVARTCSTTLPVDPTYYGAAGDIAYDNVLIGDYQRIDPQLVSALAGTAGGNPLVHIRAIPEGTLGGFTAADVTFPYTFYRRYTPNEDRRMPLPGVFAARFIEEGPGMGLDRAWNTDLSIWREGVTMGSPTCANAGNNAGVPFTEIVRFDQQENPTTYTPEITEPCRISPCPVNVPGAPVSFPETSAFSTSDVMHFPPDNAATGDPGGWMYLNLNHDTAAPPLGTSASQNWVTVMMTAENRYAVDFDAAWLGNGCSGNPGVSEVTDATSLIEIGPIDNNPFDGAQ